MSRQRKWLKVFEEFIRHLRIDSKELSAVDEMGSPLVLWDSQRLFLEHVSNGLDDGVRIFNCLKSRQLGITTVSLCIDVFWLAMHPGLPAALVTDTEANRDANRQIILRYIKSLPAKYRGKGFEIVKNNRTMMLFSNGSRLDFMVAGTRKKTNWGEGRGYAFVHMTEVAKYGDAEGLRNFEESFAVNNPDRLFLYESTANGMNHWRAKYLGGFDDMSHQRSFFIGWWAHPFNKIERSDPRFAVYGTYPITREEQEITNQTRERHGIEVTREQLCWYRWRSAQAGMTEQTLHQNQPWTDVQAFVMSGFSFFQTRVIQEDIVRALGTAETEPIYWRGGRYWIGNDFFAVKFETIEEQARRDEIELRIWADPVPNAQYVIGCDPALGRGQNADRHAIEVWRCFADKMVQVAEYASNETETRHCAWVLAHLAGVYRNCIVSVELTGGHGRVVMTELEHLRGMVHAPSYEEQRQALGWGEFLFAARWYLYHRTDSLGAGYAYNFETTQRSKVEVMNQMRDSYTTRQLIVNSVPLLREMAIVVQDGYEIKAPEGGGEDSKDDRVLATALANRAWINWVRPDLLARGYFYNAVMAEETGTAKPAEPIINKMVQDYFRKMEEIAGRGDEPPKWLTDRGLA